MYKRHSPEALSLVSLGRADSKRADVTCRGITTTGKACRNAIKKGSSEKFCHLHRDQKSASWERLYEGRATITGVEEYGDKPTRPESKQLTFKGYPTPSPSPSPSSSPSPSPPRRGSPPRKADASVTFPPKQTVPNLSSITPPLSSRSPNLNPDLKQHAIKRLFNFRGRVQNIFQSGSRNSKSSTVALVPYTPSLGTLRRNDVFPSLYPKLMSSQQSTPLPQLPSRMTHEIPQRTPQSILPSPQRTPPKAKHSNVPVLRTNSPRTPSAGVERSWETMWVPGINNLGAHITCKGAFQTDLL